MRHLRHRGGKNVLIDTEDCRLLCLIRQRASRKEWTKNGQRRRRNRTLRNDEREGPFFDREAVAAIRRGSKTPEALLFHRIAIRPSRREIFRGAVELGLQLAALRRRILL